MSCYLFDVYPFGPLNPRLLVQGVQYILFVKCKVFIDVIRDKYVNRCPALDLVNAINYVNVWVLSFGSTVIHKEVCHTCPLILIGTTPLCLGGILRVDLTVPIVSMQVLKCV